MSTSVAAGLTTAKRNPIFYKADATRVTLREFWFETKLFFWTGLIIKLFRIRPRGSTDDLAVDSILPFQVDDKDVSADTMARFEPTLDALYHLGFGPPIWFEEEDRIQATRNTLAVLRHEGDRAWAKVQRRTNFGRVPAKVKFFTTIISPTADGYLVTGNGKHDLLWPTTHDVERSRALTVEDVWARHQERMTAGVQTIPPARLAEAAEGYHVSLLKFHLARGVFQPLGDEELEMFAPPPVRAAQPATPPPLQDDLEVAASHMTVLPPAEPLDLMETATLDELRKLQTKQVNWRFALLLLSLSAGLFVLYERNGNAKDGWEFIAIIVGILLVHEAGHYLAMKLFGYRNLKMFFIPGFGAAVSGRHYNAPGWKKIIVSLMGPLPGIVAGVVILGVGVWKQNELLNRIGMLAVGLNAFNLIPVLPLDGGWVAHAALFARHPKLDVGFRLLTALIMIAAGLLPGMRVLIYIGIASLIALPMSFRIAQIVKELRGTPGLGVSPDNQSIPTDTARVILARVRDRFRSNLNAKLAAQHVVSVFESLNARPPSVAATLGLLTVHGAAFGLAIVALLAVLVVNQRNALMNFARGEQYPVSPAGIVVRGHAPVGPRTVVVIRFKHDAETRQALAALPPDRPVTQFGQTLLVDFAPQESAQQRALFDRYEKSAADLFVTHDKMHGSVNLSFKWPATAEAKQSFDDLKAYLACSRWSVAPPWASEADWPSDQRAAPTRMRHLVLALQTPADINFADRSERWKARAAAQRRGDTAEAERIDAEFKKESDDAEKQRLARIEQDYAHAPLIEQWQNIHNDKDFGHREQRIKSEIVPQLGPWPTTQPDDLLVVGGGAFETPKYGHAINCSFAKADTGLVALTQWLIAHGATDLKYSLASYGADVDDELDEQ